MLNLDKLEADREKASEDKADLFDFYHNNWDDVIRELRSHQDRERDLQSWGVENDLNTP